MSLAKATYVKAAAKDNPVAKRGEPYWHWSHFRGPKQFSKTEPTNSQLESNENAAECYAVFEDIQDYGNAHHIHKPTGDTATKDEANDWLADLTTQREEWVQRILDAADAEEEKFNNLPEQFQEGDTGTAIQDRYENMRAYADELEAIDLDEIEIEDKEFDYEGEFNAMLENLQNCSLDI